MQKRITVHHIETTEDFPGGFKSRLRKPFQYSSEDIIDIECPPEQRIILGQADIQVGQVAKNSPDAIGSAVEHVEINIVADRTVWCAKDLAAAKDVIGPAMFRGETGKLIARGNIQPVDVEQTQFATQLLMVELDAAHLLVIFDQINVPVDFSGGLEREAGFEGGAIHGQRRVGHIADKGAHGKFVARFDLVGQKQVHCQGIIKVEDPKVEAKFGQQAKFDVVEIKRIIQVDIGKKKVVFNERDRSNKSFRVGAPEQVVQRQVPGSAVAFTPQALIISRKIQRGGDHVQGVDIFGGLEIKGSCFHRAGGRLQLPIPALAGSAGQIRGRRHIGAGERGQLLDEGLAGLALGHVAAVEEQVAIVGQGLAHRGQLRCILFQGGLVEGRGAKGQAAGTAVGEQVDRGQVAVTGEDVRHLHEAVPGWIEHEPGGPIGQAVDEAVDVLQSAVEEKHLVDRPARTVLDHDPFSFGGGPGRRAREPRKHTLWIAAKQPHLEDFPHRRQGKSVAVRQKNTDIAKSLVPQRFQRMAVFPGPHRTAHCLPFFLFVSGESMQNFNLFRFFYIACRYHAVKWTCDSHNVTAP